MNKIQQNNIKRIMGSLLRKSRYWIIAAIRAAADSGDAEFRENALAALQDYLDRLREDIDVIIARKLFLSSSGGNMRRTELGEFFYDISNR